MRPTISPEMKTPRMTNSSIEYRPEPTPPQMTSPVIICAIGIAPPKPLSDSIAALTAPHDAAVVIGGEERGGADAEALLLALEVVAGQPGGLHRRRSGRTR